MASSPAEPTATVAVDSPVAFALQELTVCWDQAYEALARGDLERTAALMGIADEHLRQVGDPTADGAIEARLRSEAVAARGRLEHGMRGGLEALREELARVRQGARTLQGYKDPSHGLGGNFESRV